ncbi:hypothetical protein LCGC14_2673580 [marine sediment metagenome]|uniref:Uncharacterized protein n=1 Tax=marine sediment metagenome TaxID=412755 RepID=A0A0F8ZNF2_9ZZZZ
MPIGLTMGPITAKTAYINQLRREAADVLGLAPSDLDGLSIWDVINDLPAYLFVAYGTIEAMGITGTDTF